MGLVNHVVFGSTRTLYVVIITGDFVDLARSDCNISSTHTLYSLFNSGRRLTLYVVYFTLSRRLFYRQKIGRLLWFGLKGGLQCTKYSVFQCRRASNDAVMALLCLDRPPQVSCCLLFVSGRLLYIPLKSLLIDFCILVA